MNQEIMFQFLQRKEAVSRDARSLLAKAVESGCHGTSLKALSAFIEEIENEIKTLIREAEGIVSLIPERPSVSQVYLEKISQRKSSNE